MQEEELVDKFLDDDLTEQEAILLKQRFDTDPVFATRLRHLTDMEIALKSHALKEPKAVVKHWIPERRWVVYGVAASVLLVCLMSYQLFFSAASNDQLVRQYASEYFQEPDFLRGEEEGNTYWGQILIHYESKDFEAAGVYLEKQLADDPLDAEAYFYAGLCLLYLQEEPGRAATYFEKALALNYWLPQPCQWYWYLALYQAGDVEKAKALWREILENPSHYGYQKALKLGFD